MYLEDEPWVVASVLGDTGYCFGCHNSATIQNDSIHGVMGRAVPQWLASPELAKWCHHISYNEWLSMFSHIAINLYILCVQMIYKEIYIKKYISIRVCALYSEHPTPPNNFIGTIYIYHSSCDLFL